MSNFFSNLVNLSMLGRAQSDLRNSQAGELNMLSMYNREQRAAREAKKELREAQAELAEANRQLWEWKAASDSFRLLAKSYGDQLGRTDEERLRDRREITMSLAEQDPGIAKTEYVAKTKAELGLS